MEKRGRNAASLLILLVFFMVSISTASAEYGCCANDFYYESQIVGYTDYFCDSAATSDVDVNDKLGCCPDNPDIYTDNMASNKEDCLQNYFESQAVTPPDGCGSVFELCELGCCCHYKTGDLTLETTNIETSLICTKINLTLKDQFTPGITDSAACYDLCTGACTPTENTEETCDDGVDNDCDTFIDTADTDCQTPTQTCADNGGSCCLEALCIPASDHLTVYDSDCNNANNEVCCLSGSCSVTECSNMGYCCSPDNGLGEKFTFLDDTCETGKECFANCGDPGSDDTCTGAEFLCCPPFSLSNDLRQAPIPNFDSTCQNDYMCYDTENCEPTPVECTGEHECCAAGTGHYADGDQDCEDTFGSSYSCFDECLDPSACTSPADCTDDENACTETACENENCVHKWGQCNSEINDGCCPPGCDYGTDPDCPFMCQNDAECNDNNICTTDSCTNYACDYITNSLSCNDGNFCTENDICSGEVCTGGAEITQAIDGDQCCPSGQGFTMADDSDCLPEGCHATTPAPEAVSVEHHRGEYKLTLSWDVVCPGVEYSALKCETEQGEDCQPFIRLESPDFSLSGTTIVDNNIKAEKRYCYKVQARYQSGIKDSIITCVDSGDFGCLEYEAEFCKPGDPSMRVRTCNPENKYEIEFECDTTETPGGKCLGPFDDGTTKCVESSLCEKCNGLLGVYALTGKIKYGVNQNEIACKILPVCYLENMYKNVDEYVTCDKIETCYDYRSEYACTKSGENLVEFLGQWDTNNKCLPETDCEWEYTRPELGIGICRPQNPEEHECSKCTDEPHNNFFGLCTVETCQMFGDCYPKDSVDENGVSDGIIDIAWEKPEECINFRDLTCDDYVNEEHCTGEEKQEVNIDVVWDSDNKEKTDGSHEILENSSDLAGLGLCKWHDSANIAAQCVKDANDNLQISGFYNGADMYTEDMLPPITYIDFPKVINPDTGLYTAKDLNISFNVDLTYDGTDPTFEGKTYFAVSETGEFVYPTINTENTPHNKIETALSDGTHTVFFFSEDSGSNLEVVRGMQIEIDRIAPEIDLRFGIQPDREEHTHNNLSVNIVLNEWANCTDSLDSLSGSGSWNNLTGEISFKTATINYYGIEDGLYNYTISCSDLVGNWAYLTDIVRINSDGRIYNGYPNTTLNITKVDLRISAVKDGVCLYAPVDKNTGEPTAYTPFTNKAQEGLEFTFSNEIELNTIPLSYLNAVSHNAATYIFKIKCNLDDEPSPAYYDIFFTADQIAPVTTLKRFDGSDFDFASWHMELNGEIMLSCEDQPQNGFGCDSVLYCFDALPCTPTESFAEGELIPKTSIGTSTYVCWGSVEKLTEELGEVYGAKREEVRCEQIWIDDTNPELIVETISDSINPKIEITKTGDASYTITGFVYDYGFDMDNLIGLDSTHSFEDFTLTGKLNFESGSIAEVYFRHSDEFNQYVATFDRSNPNDHKLKLRKIEGGTPSIISEASVPELANNIEHSFNITAIGSTLSFTANGITITGTDSTFSLGKIGTGTVGSTNAQFSELKVIDFNFPQDNTVKISVLNGNNYSEIPANPAFSQAIALNPGENKIKITAYDKARNTQDNAPSEFYIYSDRTGPNHIRVIKPTATEWGDDAIFEIEVKDDAIQYGVGVFEAWVLVDGSANQLEKIEETNKWNGTVDISELEIGMHTAEIRAKDDYGNENNISAENAVHEFEIRDTTKPNITLYIYNSRDFNESPTLLTTIGTYYVRISSSETLSQITDAYFSAGKRYNLTEINGAGSEWSAVMTIPNSDDIREDEHSAVISVSVKDTHGLGETETLQFTIDAEGPGEVEFDPSFKQGSRHPKYETVYPEKVQYANNKYYTNQTELFLTGRSSEAVQSIFIHHNGNMQTFTQELTQILDYSELLIPASRDQDTIILKSNLIGTPFENTANYINFENNTGDNYRTEYGEYRKNYKIDSLAYQNMQSVLSISPALETSIVQPEVNRGYTVAVLDKEVPSDWFGVSIPLTEGNNSFYATTEDQFGNPSKTTLYKIFVDTKKPVIGSKIPELGWVLNSNKLNMSITFRDEKPSSGIKSVHLNISGPSSRERNLDIPEPTTTGTFDEYSLLIKLTEFFSRNELENGEYRITFTVEDFAGNKHVETWWFAIKSGVPDIPEPALADEAYNKIENSYDQMLNDSIFFTNDEKSKFIIEYTEEYDIDLVFAIKNTPGEISCVKQEDSITFHCAHTNNLSEGSHLIVISARRMFNEGGFTEYGPVGEFTFTIVVDKTAPTVSVDSKDMIHSAETDFWFNVGVQGERYSLYYTASLENYEIENMLIGPAEGHYFSNITLPEFESGEKVLSVSVIDQAGNNGSATKTMVVDNQPVALAITSVTTANPAKKIINGFTNDDAIIIQGTYSDNYEVDYICYTTTSDMTLTCEDTTLDVSGNSGTFNIRVDLFGENEVNTITISAFDIAGNEALATTSMKRDVTGPSATIYLEVSSENDEETLCGDSICEYGESCHQDCLILESIGDYNYNVDSAVLAESSIIITDNSGEEYSAIYSGTKTARIMVFNMSTGIPSTFNSELAEGYFANKYSNTILGHVNEYTVYLLDNLSTAWISQNKIIEIEETQVGAITPPQDMLNAYLSKYPSTLT